MKPAQGPGHKPDRVFPSAKISFAFALQVGLSRLGGSKTGGSLLSQKKGWLSQDSAGICQILLTQLDAFRNQICFCALETGSMCPNRTIHCFCALAPGSMSPNRSIHCFCALETGRIISAPAPPAHHGAAHARRPLFCPGPTRLAANKVKPFFSMGG